MKKVLLDGNKKFFKANMHCHSTKSDGRMTVEELKERYMEEGYSIIAFSDHEHLIDNSHLNDENFLSLTACELAIKEDPNLSTLQKRDMKCCHFNLFAKEPTNVDTPCYSSIYDHFKKNISEDDIVHTCGEYERSYTTEGMNEIIRLANEKGFLVSYNHPRWCLESPMDYLRYKGLWAVEIYNTSVAMKGLSGNEVHVYEYFLREGERMACIMGDDNHSMASTCGAWTVINADKLDYKSVITAMENHELYASTGPEIKDLYIEDGVAHMTFAKGVAAIMVMNGRTAFKQVAENPDGDNKVSFEIPINDGYTWFRFEVVDAAGEKANTCAYFLDEI